MRVQESGREGEREGKCERVRESQLECLELHSHLSSVRKATRIKIALESFRCILVQQPPKALDGKKNQVLTFLKLKQKKWAGVEGEREWPLPPLLLPCTHS